MTLSFCPGVHRACDGKEYEGICLGIKGGRHLVLIVPNVKITMEAQHSIPLLSLHDSSRKNCLGKQKVFFKLCTLCVTYLSRLLYITFKP